MKFIIGSFLISILISMCPTPSTTEHETVNSEFDLQGHRGCRGLFPENTLPAFQKALELKVNTLELDLAVSKDKQLVVSHEPYFRAGLSIDPNGVAITPENQLEHNIYKMDYDSIQKYDVGTLTDPKHPERENIKTYKPLLSQVVNKAQHFAYAMNSKVPYFNIEIKRNPKFDNEFHPGAEEFVNLVLSEVTTLDIFDKTIIQSFDLETLRIVKSKNSRIKLALLIQNRKSVQENLEELGFKPDVYSCYFKLLRKEDVEYCHEKGIKVIPWTVNEIEDIENTMALGIDGIITDYPDRVIALRSK